MLPDFKFIETRGMGKLRNTSLANAWPNIWQNASKVIKVSTEYAHFEGGWVWVVGFVGEGGGSGEPYPPALKPQRIL